MKDQRQPVHTVYGGAHLFRFDTARKLGRLAVQALETNAADAGALAEALACPGLDEAVYERVRVKLKREPVEDFRIDFEDGYGYLSAADEDAHAGTAATEVARGMLEGTLPPFLGVRIKPLTAESRDRALRTLRIFFDRLNRESQGRRPEPFFVTLPKITTPEQVAEAAAELPAGVGLEIMIETTQAILNPGALLDAAGGRCVAAHFGAYDYLSSCGISSVSQSLRHLACDFARNQMLAAFAHRGIWLADGVTPVVPAGDRDSVCRAWRRHFEDVRHSLASGFYQGWDVHPAQLVTRFAAVYTFFREALPNSVMRLRHFEECQRQATRLGAVFDDAATIRGLRHFFRRAIDCGAIGEDEAQEKRVGR